MICLLCTILQVNSSVMIYGITCRTCGACSESLFHQEESGCGLHVKAASDHMLLGHIPTSRTHCVKCVLELSHAAKRQEFELEPYAQIKSLRSDVDKVMTSATRKSW